jgi:2-iminobutanoate/2-iminopropanoate deaminase
MTLYIPDVALWNQVNDVYEQFFGPHKPARTVVPTKDLHFGFKIEIEAIAYIE